MEEGWALPSRMNWMGFSAKETVVKRKLVALPVLAVTLLGLVAGNAYATLLTSAVRQTFPTNVTSTFGSTTIIPINDAGNTSLNFTVAGNQPVLISFNADCLVDTAGTSLAVEILVDGTPAPGTGAGSGGSQLL